MEGLYYKHSGRFTWPGVFAGLVAGSLAGLVLGYVYAYVILYIPLAGYVTFILTGGFGLLQGVAVAGALKWQKVRNPGLAGVVLFLTTTVAFYFSWAVWVYAFIRRAEGEVSLLALVLQPGAMWETIRFINANGAWSIRGSTPTGVILWTFWGLEAAIIFGVALWAGLSWINKEPFCERCDKWCDHEEGVCLVPNAGAEEFKQHMEGKDFRYLETLGVPPPDCSDLHRLDLYSCKSCANTNTLEATRIVKTEKKGKIEEETTEVINKLLLSTSEADQIRQIGKRLAGPAADAGAESGATV